MTSLDALLAEADAQPRSSRSAARSRCRSTIASKSHGGGRETARSPSQGKSQPSTGVLAGETGSATTTFADAGAFAYWLRAIPWIVEGFSVSAQRAALVELQRRLDDEGPLTIEEPAFVLEAAKTG